MMRASKCSRRFGIAVAALTAAAATAPAAVLEEIVVTAQKREQNVQDVGIAITAFTGEQLEQIGYTNAQQVTSLAPGVSTVQPNGEANYSIAIRGAASSDFTSNNESPCSIYLDEVYISQMSGAGFMLFDMERVEILRGPQGTLFGRNATGGLVHFITRKPTREFDGHAKVTFGEHDQIRSEAAVGGALADTLAARVSIATHHNDGYVENRFLDEDLNNANDYAGRIQFLYTPDENVEFLLNARYSLQQIRTGFFEFASAVTTGVRTPGLPDPFLGGYVDLDDDPFEGDYDKLGHNDLETWGMSGTLKWQFGDVLITSISDFQSVERDYIEDSDSSPFTGFNFFVTTDSEQFSQELRLSGEWEQIRWVAGFYYLDIGLDDSNGGESNIFSDLFSVIIIPSAIAGMDVFDPTLFLLPTDERIFEFGNDRGIDNPYSIDTQSWSLFGQIEYEFNPQWTAILGFRWIDEEKDLHYMDNLVRFIPGTRHRNGNPNIILNLVDFRASQSDGLWSARVELDWQPNEDLLLYASWNRGVKAGGYNAPFLPLAIGNTEETMVYGPERLDAFEVGFKSSLFDGRARFNGAAYYYDYEDYQGFNLIGIDALTFNTPAENYGFELEAQATPIEGLDLLAGVGYIHAELEFDGLKTPPVQTPKWNVSGLARYQWPAFGGALAVQGDFDYRSAHIFGLADVFPEFVDTLDHGDYLVANASLSYTTGDERWQVSVFVSNLFDREYRVQQFDLSGPAIFGMVEEYYGRPRWVGGSIRYSWD
jgi:iron complex outermembrane receptor protein